jgi:signal peptidase I
MEDPATAATSDIPADSAAPVKKSGNDSPKPPGGVKETIESILVAFILAFVFRAFVVEAFVIPTGSMATTLLGAHTRFHCPDCGYSFDVNYDAPRRSSDPESDEIVPDKAGVITDHIYCPNCGMAMPPEQLDDPHVFYGDRILVLKYLYLLQDPKRWDVVVFKAPIDREGNYSTNYIKRLIANPGESVMVIDGDVYVHSPQWTDPLDFRIQTKPKPVQDAMWRLVYDNDYHPQLKDRGESSPWKQPWTVTEGDGWKLDDPATHGRTFAFNSASGSSRLRFDPTANPPAQTLSEYLVYDQQQRRDGMIDQRSTESTYPLAPRETSSTCEMPVSDVDLRLTYQRTSGTGPLRLELTKRDHRFTAEITPTQASVFQDFQGRHTQIGNSFTLPSSSRPIRIEFSNVDYQVTLRIDDQMVAQSTPADFSPNIQKLIEEFENHLTPPPGTVDIAASSQQCAITHLSLWRDQYYYNDRGQVLRATPENFPQNAQVLGKDEYFVMGDNSLLSFDARCWRPGVQLPDEGINIAGGKVPKQFMLGKAFYVYWPAGYLPYSSGPALVPNFGSMRFIH